MAATPWFQRTIDEFHARNGLGIQPWGDHLLLLTARGARSGRPITTPLVYRREGNQYIVVASKGGSPRHPHWYHNVEVNPDVEVEVASPGGTERFRARARAVPSGPERDRLFAFVAEIWPAFHDYKTKTTRIIPIVILERALAEPTG
jgi:deazaflavin-dependent oxidoreductase (nitroreductase family)